MINKINKISIFMFGLCSIMFMGITNVHASNLIQTPVDNVYYTRRGGDQNYVSAQYKTYSMDGKNVYCIEPGVEITTDLYEESEGWVNSPYSSEINKLIQLYGYYGYEYPGHNTMRYRMAAQALIWETVGNQIIEFWTEQYGYGNYIDIEYEKNEIKNLVNDHYKTPVFDSSMKKGIIGQPVYFYDSTNLLSNFEVYNSDESNVEINNEILKVVPNKVGETSIILKRKSYTSNPTQIFVGLDAKSQKMAYFGLSDPIISVVKVNALGGKVEIQKLDSKTLLNKAQGNATLKGAVYGVFKMDGTKIAELITDSNGYAKSDYLSSVGKLYIQELKASEGYKLDPNKYEIEISENNLEPSIQVKEEIIEGKIKISKYDSETNSCKAQGEASLIGAKYQVVNSNGEVVDTLTIGEDCIAVSKNLPYGNYKIVEIDSSKGYLIDNNSYNVFINSETTFNVISKEDVIKGKIKISKYDSENNSCKAQGSATLKGAIYEIFDIKGNLVDILTIGEDCTAVSKNLPYGNYKIKEKDSSKGYLLDVIIYNANITENKIIDIVSKEDVIKNRISILKQYDYVDSTTQFLNAEANVTFEIYYENGTKYGTITTDENGYALVDLPYGTWKFHQLNTKDGYEKIYDFYITVDENSKREQYYNILNNKLSAYLKVIKIDSETGNVIAIKNTTFKIFNTDTNKYVTQYVSGKMLDKFYTDENGIMMTYLKLEAGNYKLIEIDSPNGYLIDSNGLDFTIGENTKYDYTDYGTIVTLYYKNKSIKGKIEIWKNGELFGIDNNLFNYNRRIVLEGIVYNIYADEDIKSSDGTIIYYQKNDLVGTITTDENGYAVSDELPLGKYRVVEVKANADYQIDNTEYFVELMEIDNRTSIVYSSLKMTNILKKGKVEITKKDLITGDVIANTILEIYNDKDELIYTGTTNEEGKIIIDNLKIGKYYILEKKASTGYIITTEKVDFEIKDNGEIVKAEIQNKPIFGGIEITKVDISTGEVLPNTLIEVYNDRDELIFSGITDENGKILIENLRYGKYYFVEKLAPEGYQINNEKMWFEIFEDGKIVKSELSDEKIIVEVPNTLKNDYMSFIMTGISVLGIGVITYGTIKKRKFNKK